MSGLDVLTLLSGSAMSFSPDPSGRWVVRHVERLNGGAEWLPEEISQVIGWAVVVKSSTDGEYWTEVEPVIEFAYEVRTMTDVRREYEDPLLFRWQLRLAEADG